MDEVEEELKMKGLLVLPGSPKTILSLSSKGHSLSDPIKTILCIVVDLQGTGNMLADATNVAPGITRSKVRYARWRPVTLQVKNQRLEVSPGALDRSEVQEECR